MKINFVLHLFLYINALSLLGSSMKELTKPNMTRKKVNLAWIVSDSARKACLKKRKLGLMKKVSQLTTLCGVNAFVIICSPDDKEPSMWPSRPVVQQLLTRFQTLSEIERSKKMMNQERYIKERSTKVEEQLNKLQRKNKELDVSNLLFQHLHLGKRLSEFNTSELHGLFWFLQERRKEIKKRLIYCQQVNAVHEAEAFPPPLPAENKQSPTAVGDMVMRNPIESALWDQWFMEGVNHSENEANLGLRAPDQTIFDTNFNYATNQMELAQGNFIPNYNNEHPDQMQLPYETNFNLNPSGGGHANETLLPSEFEFFIGSGDVGIPFDVTKP